MIALLVNSLYNIVDQVFIGWGVGYLGNGATNVVFPITIIALALSMMVGNGGAAYLSLKLGEEDAAAAQKGVGNAVALVAAISFPLTATGIVMKVNQIMIAILLGIATGAQPILGFNYGAKNYGRVKKALEIALVASKVVSIAGFLIFQFAPMSVVSLFGSEEGRYNEFAVMAFRIFLLLCPLTGFQTVTAVYLQAVGKPVTSAVLSPARQILFFVPAALLLPRWMGVTGVLWTGPVADGLAFALSLALLLGERGHLKKEHPVGPSNAYINKKEAVTYEE